MNGGRLNGKLGFQGAEERGLLVSNYIKNSGSETRRGREEGGGRREGGTSVHLHVREDAVMRSGAHNLGFLLLAVLYDFISALISVI